MVKTPPAGKVVLSLDTALPPPEIMESGRRCISDSELNSSSSWGMALKSNAGSLLPVSEPSSTQRKEQGDADRLTPGAVVRNAWARTAIKWRGLRKVVRKHPLTAAVPLVVFALAVLVGLLGVWAGCQGVRTQRQLLTADAAATSAREISMTLQLWVAPAVAAVSVIREQPYAPTLLDDLHWLAPLVVGDMDSFADTDYDRDASAVFSLGLYPWGINTAIYPPTPSNLASINLNVFTYPELSSSSIEFAASPAGTYALIGPIKQPEGVTEVLFAYYYNVWLPSSDPNETWGMNQSFTFPWAQGIPMGNQTQPPWRGPCGANCAPRLQPEGTYLVFWGFAVITLPGESFIHRLDSLSDKSKHDTPFNYLLYRRDLPSESDRILMQQLDTLPSGQVILAKTQGASSRATDVENTCADLSSSMQISWTVCVTPAGGYYPSWRVPAQIAVVFASFILGLLMLMLMVSHANHKALVTAMLPPKAIKHLSLHQTYAEPFQMVTILFSDIVSYTELSSQLSPMELVQMLDHLYSSFDDLVDKHGLYKVETIGDAFMCVGGAPDPCNPYDAARRVAQMALDMVRVTETFETSTGRKIQIRVGMHTGDVTAAVMGRKMPHWCLVGDAVNVSSRMESNSRPMQVHVGATTAHLLTPYPEFSLKPRGLIDVKGKGPMCTYWLTAAAGGCQTPAVAPSPADH